MTIKKIQIVTLFSACVLILCGCAIPKGPVEVVLPNRSLQQEQNQKVDQAHRDHQDQRFQQVLPGQAVSQDAVRLAQERDKLAEEVGFLREKNQTLTDEDKNLKNQLAITEEKLKQAEKELKDATNLLVDMQLELNNWKTDVLGFRDEMRQADKAQLDALLKILTVLGGEVKSELPKNEASHAADANSGKASQVK